MAAYNLSLNTDTKKFLRDLSKIQGGVHQATARTVNSLAKKTINRYNTLLQKDFNVRTNFTLRATKMFPATFERKSKPGVLRPLRDINALVYIRKMKGNSEHYLARQEEGIDKPLQKSAKNSVSIPLASTARVGGTFEGKVRPKYALRKFPPASLRIGQSGADFGSARDKFSDPQRWAIVNKYKNDNPYGWKLDRPFFFRYKKRDDVYAMKGNKIVTIRLLSQRNKIKKRPNFQKAFEQLSEAEMQSAFNTVAQRILNQL